jgi:hypothetical protein
MLMAASWTKEPDRATGMATRTVAATESQATPNRLSSANLRGTMRSSARATPVRGAPKEAATLMPPMDTRVPRVTSHLPPLPMNMEAASVTGAVLLARAGPRVPTAMACTAK